MIEKELSSNTFAEVNRSEYSIIVELFSWNMVINLMKTIVDYLICKQHLHSIRSQLDLDILLLEVEVVCNSFQFILVFV